MKSEYFYRTQTSEMRWFLPSLSAAKLLPKWRKWRSSLCLSDNSPDLLCRERWLRLLEELDGIASFEETEGNKGRDAAGP